MTRAPEIDDYHRRLRPEDREICERLADEIDRGLPEASGSFEAAEARFVDVSEIDTDRLAVWLSESRVVQWDYEHIRTNRGLVKRTEF